MDFCWATRGYSTTDLRPVEAVVALALAGQPGDKPLVVADYTDNPGGGGYGDATGVPEGPGRGRGRGVAFHAICDPEAVHGRRCAPASGCTTTIALGGKTDPPHGRRSPDPDRRGDASDQRQVHRLRPDGRRPRTRLRAVDGVPVGRHRHDRDHQQRPGGRSRPVHLDGASTRPATRTVCVKSMQHFRAAFEPIAREVILVDTGALCSESYHRRNCSTRRAARSGRSIRWNRADRGRA